MAASLLSPSCALVCGCTEVVGETTEDFRAVLERLFTPFDCAYYDVHGFTDRTGLPVTQMRYRDSLYLRKKNGLPLPWVVSLRPSSAPAHLHIETTVGRILADCKTAVMAQLPNLYPFVVDFSRQRDVHAVTVHMVVCLVKDTAARTDFAAAREWLARTAWLVDVAGKPYQV